MNYNNQYEHITVKLCSLNISLNLLFMLSYTCYCTKHALAYLFIYLFIQHLLSALYTNKHASLLQPDCLPTF